MAELERHEYIRLMGDLMVLALQTDLTRVASLMVAPERWSTPQKVHGLFEQPILHHSWTHQQGDDRVRAELARLDQYHVEQFAYVVKKMLAVKEGDSTLLDNTMFLFGSGLSGGNTSTPTFHSSSLAVPVEPLGHTVMLSLTRGRRSPIYGWR